MKRYFLIVGLMLSLFSLPMSAWHSVAVGVDVETRVRESAHPKKDAGGRYMTVVYLENLSCEKIGQNTLEEDVQWLLDEGYRVVEVDYAHHEKAKSPYLNADIVAINDALNKGSFAGASSCSDHRSYVLFEGYRIARDVSYYLDDPTVYNWPGGYQQGDSLYMDIAYPANPSKAVPTIISFSYSNSWHGNEHKRLFLGYTLAMFDDSFLQGAPAVGMAWAMADHPKYCDWGNGKPQGGANKDFGSFETNPDAVRKVKSAIRTLRFKGEALGLSGKIGIYGFSRGSTAASLAIGNKQVEDFENAGLYQGVSSAVQVAALGPGVFDYTLIYDAGTAGDEALEKRCANVWGALSSNREKWESQGAPYLISDKTTAPVFFFYNSSDEPYYKHQVLSLKTLLDKIGVENEMLIDYSSGHAVPNDAASLEAMYDFFLKHLQADDKPSSLKKLWKNKAKKRPFDWQVMAVAPSEITCSFSLSKPEKVQFSVYDLAGRCCFSKVMGLQAGDHIQHLPLGQEAMLGTGVFVLMQTSSETASCYVELR